MTTSFLAWMWPTLVAFLLLLLVGHFDWAWRRRRILAELAMGLLLAGLPFVATIGLGGSAQVLLGSVMAWGVLLGARLLFGRLPEQFLRRGTQSNSVIALVVLVAVFDIHLTLSTTGLQSVPRQLVLATLLLAAIVVGLGFLYQVLWTLKHYRLRKLNPNLRPRDLPTVTLAIPARNETHALDAALRAGVASTYPRLEIIVLDDCSQDKTSQIIRSFAHDGVRFVQGAVPAEGWLGKNQAQRTLAEAASGDFIIFADVDTLVAPESITQLVNYALSNKLEMVTVLPRRRDGWSLATTLTYLRYFWQVALPLTRRRVPVASQLWLIRRRTLQKLGGFDAVRQKIVPEGYFARRLVANDAYRFVVSTEELGVTTAKRWSSQTETAIRFLYPTFHRQPYMVLLGVLFLVGVMLLPFLVLIGAIRDEALLVPAALACGLFWLSYCLVIIRTHVVTWPVAVLLLPVALAQEVVLLVASMLLYEFGNVNWKGRNVCFPVIRE